MYGYGKRNNEKKKIKEIIPVLRARRHHRCATLFSSFGYDCAESTQRSFQAVVSILNAGHLNAPRHIKNVCARPRSKPP